MKHPILIADDDDNDVLLMKRALAAAQVINPVCVVSTGEEAIEYLSGEGQYADRRKFPFPVLLMLNLQMPRKNGAEVLGWLQAQSDLPPLRIIIISGQTDPRPIQQAINLGARCFLRKPPTAEKLMEALRDIEELRLIPSAGGVRLEIASILAAALIN
jgi:CheY-like chemotaxis protein